MKLIQCSGDNLQEGEILNKWMHNRFKRNKNVLLVITGSTGSSKSYTTHRIAELWYKYEFDKEYPVATHTCFSVGEIMQILAKGNLKKGELIIFEEAGANVGALDFQNKVSKIFTYVMQSFRSMNVGILFNLPVLSMLNKSLRLLIHGHFITAGIDFDNNISQIKPLFHQLNQERSKSYWKYIIVKMDKKAIKIQRFKYSIPSEGVVRAYESKKCKFVAEITESFAGEMARTERIEQWKLTRNGLTETQQEMYDFVMKGLTAKQIAEKKNCKLRSVYNILESIEKKGFAIKLSKNAKKNEVFEEQTPPISAVT